MKITAVRSHRLGYALPEDTRLLPAVCTTAAARTWWRVARTPASPGGASASAPGRSPSPTGPSSSRCIAPLWSAATRSSARALARASTTACATTARRVCRSRRCRASTSRCGISPAKRPGSPRDDCSAGASATDVPVYGYGMMLRRTRATLSAASQRRRPIEATRLHRHQDEDGPRPRRATFAWWRPCAARSATRRALMVDANHAYHATPTPSSRPRAGAARRRLVRGAGRAGGSRTATPICARGLARQHCRRRGGVHPLGLAPPSGASGACRSRSRRCAGWAASRSS